MKTPINFSIKRHSYSDYTKYKTDQSISFSKIAKEAKWDRIASLRNW